MPHNFDMQFSCHLTRTINILEGKTTDKRISELLHRSLFMKCFFPKSIFKKNGLLEKWKFAFMKLPSASPHHRTVAVNSTQAGTQSSFEERILIICQRLKALTKLFQPHHTICVNRYICLSSKNILRSAIYFIYG